MANRVKATEAATAGLSRARFGRAWLWEAVGRSGGIGAAAARRALRRALARAGDGDVAFSVRTDLVRGALGEQLVCEIAPRRLRLWLPSRLPQRPDLANFRDCFVGHGDWSVMLRAFSKHPARIQVAELVAAGLDWRSTPTYARLREAIARGERPQHLNLVVRDLAMLDAHFARLISIIESIRRHGVVRRSALTRDMRSSEGRLGWSWWREASEHDIGVAITADGRPVRFRSGSHRTAIALELAIPRVPVEVKLVHADWLRSMVARHGPDPLVALAKGVASLANP